MAVSQPTLSHSQGDSLTNLLITVFVQVQPKGHREPCKEVGSLSLAKHLVGFELGTSDSGCNALKITLLKRETFSLVLVSEKAFSQLKLLTAPLIRSVFALL